VSQHSQNRPETVAEQDCFETMPPPLRDEVSMRYNEIAEKFISSGSSPNESRYLNVHQTIEHKQQPRWNHHAPASLHPFRACASVAVSFLVSGLESWLEQPLPSLPLRSLGQMQQ
jgi:hypothetical protein